MFDPPASSSVQGAETAESHIASPPNIVARSHAFRPESIRGHPSKSPEVASSQTTSAKKRKTSSTPRDGSHERSKTTRACDSCRSKKTRCSGTRPCVRCVRLALPCEYNASYSRGRPPSPLPGTTPFQIGPEIIVPDDSTSGITLSRTYGSSHDERALAPRVPALHDHPTSSRNSPDPGSIDFEGHYLGPDAGISFLGRAWRRLNQDHGKSIPTGLQNEAPQNAAVIRFGDRPFSPYIEANFTLPSRTASLGLITMFLDSAVVTYRVLHRQTLERWLFELYDLGEPLINRIPTSLAGRAAVIFAVFAMASLHEEHKAAADARDVDNARSESWFIAADELLSVETGPPKIETIQAKFIQCLYLLASSRANQSWYTFGTMVQLILALGLHRRKAQKVPQSDAGYIQNELRKRVFWASYTLDKYLTVMLGRPRHFHYADTDQDFPDELNDEDMVLERRKYNGDLSDCAITAFIFHARLSQIVEEISREVYTIRSIPEPKRLDAAKRLTRDLEGWKESLPPLLNTIRASSLVPPFRRQNNVLRFAFAHAMIHANRPFLLSHLSSPGPTTIAKDLEFNAHVQKCVNAAKLIVETVNSLADSDDWALFPAFWFTHYISFCAIMILYIHVSQQHQSRTSKQSGRKAPLSATEGELLTVAERCQRHLSEATRKNCPSRRYSIILEELRRDVYRQIEEQTNKENVVPEQRDVGNDANYNALGEEPSTVQRLLQDSVPAEQGGGTDARMGADQSAMLSVTHPIQDVNSSAGQMAPSTFNHINNNLNHGNFSFDNWSLLDWAQIDTWAYSTTAENPLVPTEWSVT